MPSETSAGKAATLILVRHGETEGQSSIRYHGRTDVALDEQGRSQMRAAARALADQVFTRVFASSLRRATEGARIIAGEGMSIVTIPEFVEIDFGNFEGMTIEEIRGYNPAEFERWQRHRLDADYQYPGGESGQAFRARVESGIERMFEHWRQGQAAITGTALLVAHRGVIRIILNKLAGVTAAIALGSIHIVDYDSDWHARALDLTSHLVGLGRQ